jgi:hypothetical protein
MSRSAFPTFHYAPSHQPAEPASGTAKAAPTADVDLRGARWVPRHYDDMVGETHRSLRRSVAIAFAILAIAGCVFWLQ